MASPPKAPADSMASVESRAGIVGFADLTLGAAVDEVLEAHSVAAPTRFRGIRHAAAFDPHPEIRKSHTDPPQDLYQSARFREGFARLNRFGLSFDAWQYHPQMRALVDLARAFPDTPIVLDHFGGPLGIGPYKGKRTEIFLQLEGRYRGTCAMSERGRQTRRNQYGGEWIRLAQAAIPSEFG